MRLFAVPLAVALVACRPEPAAPPRATEVEIPAASEQADESEQAGALDAGAPAPAPDEEVPLRPGGESVAATVARVRSRFRQCYVAELAKRPGLTAKLRLRVEIDQNGRVKDAADSGSPVPDAALLACALKVARAMQFPPASGDAVFEFPLSFTPSP